MASKTKTASKPSPQPVVVRAKVALDWLRSIVDSHFRGDISFDDFHRQMREAHDKDEKHICPLQLGTIERCVRLWTNPGDLVLSPFAGIGSELFVALAHGRRAVGIELKPEYWEVGVRNVRGARAQQSLFGEAR